MKLPGYTDDKLIKQFNKGDIKALSQVYHMYYAHLCYFAFRLTGNKEEAEDIVSVTLEILLQRYKDFETLSNIKAFLYITVRNRCLDYLRSIEKQKLAHRELSGITEAGEAPDLFENETIRAKLYQEIYQQIEQLPAKQKKVFKLFYLEGMRVNEIAEKLGMTANAVSFNKFKALEQLRNTLFNKKLLPILISIICLKKNNCG